MALLDVVHQVLDTFGNALALGVYSLFLRFGVEGQVVAGGRCGHPLLDRKADAVAGLGVGFYGFGHAHQGAGVEHVDGGGIGGHGIFIPGGIGKAAVATDLGRFEALGKQAQGFFGIILLQGLQFFRCKVNLRRLGLQAAANRSRVHGLEGLHGFGPAFAQGLLKLLGCLFHEIGGSLTHFVTFEVDLS
jgi:hypothetical protein